ncbi:MAG: Wzy polymerase domain-containing protein [Polaromonas sp.]|nr:Wzy polymerase domain-containing protein [Polaromonas sp.]
MKRYINPTLAQAGLVIVLTLPWLSPFAPGPSPAVVPLLVSLGCLAMLCGTVSSCGTRLLSPHVIALSLVSAALVSSMLGLIQYLGWSGHLGPWANQTSAGEAFANLRQRNHFASLLNIGLVCVIWLAQTGRSIPHSPLPALYAIAFLLGAGNAVSGSRAGLLQLGMLTLAYGYWHITARHSLNWRLLLAVWLAYGLTAWGLPVLTDISGGIFSRAVDGSSCAGRRVLWSNVLELIRQKPWFGWGWGELDYAHYMTLYSSERFCDILDNAHNLPLHLAVELGVPFALVVCTAFFWGVLRARPWREIDPVRQMAWGVLALILLHSLLEYPLWYGPFQIAAGLCIYLLAVARKQPERTLRLPLGEESGRAGPNYFLAVTAALMTAFVAHAAWDYHRVSQIYQPYAQRDPAYRENTLEKIRGTNLFGRQYEFAALSMTALTPSNALEINALAINLLHYSPEPRVIEKVIESAVMLGHDDEALLHLARYRAAFPVNHARWRRSLTLTPQVTQ